MSQGSPFLISMKNIPHSYESAWPRDSFPQPSSNNVYSASPTANFATYLPTNGNTESRSALNIPSGQAYASQNSAPRSLLQSWKFEFVAALLSIASTVAIIGVLWYEDGKPITRWHFFVSLNTVISVLGTISKATMAFAISACIGQQKWNWAQSRTDSINTFMRFDEASRGPLGSAKLFTWLNIRHWASLGAFVTVASLAFEPFLQAVISSVDRLDEIPSGTALLRGQSIYLAAGSTQNAFTTDESDHIGNSPLHGFTATQPDFGLVSSIYNGLSNSSFLETQSVDHLCETGNCTWPLYATLAVCSTCTDVSSGFDIHNSIDNGSIDGLAVNLLNYSLPYANIYNEYGKYDTGNFSHIFMVANTTIEPSNTISLRDAKTLLMSFLVVRASDDYMRGKAAWEESHPKALECGLYLCTHIYQTKVENGTLQETVIDSSSQRDPTSYQPTIGTWDDTWGLQKNPDGLFSDPLYRTDLRLSIPQEQTKHLAPGSSTQFDVTQNAIVSTMDYLTNITSIAPRPFDILRRQSVYGQQIHFSRGNQNFDRLPLVTYPLANSSDIVATFNNMARSMTNQIRNDGGTPQSGTVSSWVIYIKIRWPFLTFPLLLLAIGCLYVLLSVQETSRLQLPVWRESALPTFLYGFDDETQRLIRGAQQDIGDSSLDRDFRVRFDKEQMRLRVVDP